MAMELHSSIPQTDLSPLDPMMNQPNQDIDVDSGFLTDSGSDDCQSIGVDTPFICKICGKGFAIPARLQRHQRVHTGEKPYSCEFCEKTFSVKENLNVHRRIHTKERPYKCDICERAFEHSGKLHRHMRTHTGERPHKCEVCGKTFVQSGQLVIHLRAHTGEKPYSCEFCPKGFTCSKQLKVHIRTHTGEKPYKCDECGKTFGYNHVLKMHKMSHLGEKLYKCTLCDKFFNSRKGLDSHIRDHDDNSGNVKQKRKSTKTQKKKSDTIKQKGMPLSGSNLSTGLNNYEGNSNRLYTSIETNNIDYNIPSPGYSSDDSGRVGRYINDHIPNTPYSPSSNESDDLSSNSTNSLYMYNDRLPFEQNSFYHPSQNVSMFLPHMNEPVSSVPKLSFFTLSNGEKIACPTDFVFYLKEKGESPSTHWNIQQELIERLKREETKRNREEIFTHSVKKVLESLLEPEILLRFGYPKTTTDEILINALQVLHTQGCVEPSLTPMDRIKVNLRLLLECCVTDQNLWTKFGWKGKSIEEIVLEFLQHC